MSPAVEQLVRDAVELTGAELPALLDDDAPVLSDAALADGDDGGFYLVGLVGGKEVGKSALVNALVGRPITTTTSHGPGTEIAVAYAHVSQEGPLRAMLEREVPGRYRIVTHDLPALRRQVLVDLPDIDSHYESHLAVTRAMLRHTLFPLWLQSVEKYADLQPQQMLAKVAAGNAAQNFVFCLNKADQLEEPGFGGRGSERAEEEDDHPDLGIERWGPALGGKAAAPRVVSEPRPLNAQMIELRDDCAARLGRTLSLAAPPRVFMVSAKHPDHFDFPRLRAVLSRQKEDAAVRQGRQLAARRQDQSLLDWLNGQQLAERADRLDRLRREAEELTAARLAEPLVEGVISKIADDPANRSALADDILADRVARWPLVNLVHTIMAPLFALVRTMGAKNVAPLMGAEALVEFHLGGQGWSAAGGVQSAFAQLRQSYPVLAGLYAEKRLWEDLPAEGAAASLSRRLTAAVERQRVVARERLAGRRGVVAPLVRVVLTVGALLWFPLVQPVLQEWLGHPFGWSQWRLALKAIILVLGADYLLRSAGFLAIYYVVLWLALRWNTHHRVARLLGRWRLARDPNPDLNLATQSLQWVDDLTAPIRQAHDRATNLAKRAEQLRAEVVKAA